MVGKEINLNLTSLNTMFSMITKDTFLTLGLILKRSIFGNNQDKVRSTQINKKISKIITKKTKN